MEARLSSASSFRTRVPIVDNIAGVGPGWRSGKVPRVPAPQAPGFDCPVRTFCGAFPTFLVRPRAHTSSVTWELVDPADVAATPDRYRRFVQESKAEFGLAKSGYVVSRSGWFSDRSACYLASGRPVVAQDTGFPAYLPTGDGLLCFADADDVVAAVERINGDYGRHRRAARVIAEEHLDSDRVLARLLEHLGAP